MGGNKNPLAGSLGRGKKAPKYKEKRSTVPPQARLFLSNIFSEIAYKVGLISTDSDGVMLWQKLMNIYLDAMKQAHREVEGTEPDPGLINSIKGNIKRQLQNNTMTWRMFCNAMYFLRVTKIDFKLTVHRRNTAEVIEVERTLTLGKTARDVAQNFEDTDDDNDSGG